MHSVFRSDVPTLPLQLAVKMRDLCELRVFVETGTYRGGTTRLAAPLFDTVHTIEGSAARFEAGNDLEWPHNVKRYCGDSGEMLEQVLNGINEPCLFFLDAHWIACGAPLEDDPLQAHLPPCPLTAELETIARSGWHGKHGLMIDDAHVFLRPPYAHRGSFADYPSLDEICAMLPGYYVFVHLGILCAVPDAVRIPMAEWLVQQKESLARYGPEGPHL